jgi:hypothetical protein
MNLLALPAFAGAHIRMLQRGQDGLMRDSSDVAPTCRVPPHLSLRLRRILVTRHRGARARHAVVAAADPGGGRRGPVAIAAARRSRDEAR